MEPDYNEEYGFAQGSHYCKHGTYVGGWAGPDYLCGLCEMGQDYHGSYLGYRVITKMLNEDRSVRHHLPVSREFITEEDARNEIRRQLSIWTESLGGTSDGIADDEYLAEIVHAPEDTHKGQTLVMQWVLECYESGGWFTYEEMQAAIESGQDITFKERVTV